MAKKISESAFDIDYHKIYVAMTNGEKFETKSCYGKEGDTIVMDVDPWNHPAWKDGQSTFINVKDDQISKFNKKFGTISLAKKPTAETAN